MSIAEGVLIGESLVGRRPQRRLGQVLGLTVEYQLEMGLKKALVLALALPAIALETNLVLVASRYMA